MPPAADPCLVVVGGHGGLPSSRSSYSRAAASLIRPGGRIGKDGSEQHPFEVHNRPFVGFGIADEPAETHRRARWRVARHELA